MYVKYNYDYRDLFGIRLYNTNIQKKHMQNNYCGAVWSGHFSGAGVGGLAVPQAQTGTSLLVLGPQVSRSPLVLGPGVTRQDQKWPI